MKSAKCRVLVVEDHPLVRFGLRAAFAVDKAIQLVGEVGGCRALPEVLDQKRPDVVVLDHDLPDGSSHEAIRRIKAARPLCKVVVLSAYDDRLCGRWTLQCGAHGYVNKSSEPGAIRRAVLSVWRGELVFGSDARSWLLEGSRDERLEPIQRLSSREFEVFFLLGQGRNSKEAAEYLGVSSRTIETHHRKIRDKLSIPHHDALIRLATMVFYSHRAQSAGVRRDMELIAAFESRVLAPESWTHRAHLRVGFVYLSRRPFANALQCLRTGIRALNATHGKDDAYHETITVAFAHLIRSRLQTAEMYLHSEEFLEEHPELFTRDPLGVLDEHYSRERLMSPEARAGFVTPDVEPLPEVDVRR